MGRDRSLIALMLMRSFVYSGLALALALVACGEAGKKVPAGDALGNGRDDGGSGTGDGDDGDGDSRSDEDPSSGDSESGDPETCAKAEVMAKRVIPTVWLLVDGSGSMATSLTGGAGAPSRWTLLRDALVVANKGLVPKLQGVVSFGLFVYDGGLWPGVLVEGVCPRVVEVKPALSNFNAINAAYPTAQTGASTPTHYALLALQNRIKMVGPSKLGPTYVILATDGRPNLCDFHDGIPASVETEQEAVTTVAELAAAGTKTFAISMAGGDSELQVHLNALAKAGATGESAFTPTTGDALVAALTKIIGGTVSCDVELEGTIAAGRECAGEVLLSGQKLECGGNDGFQVKKDLRTLELKGMACEKLQQDPKATLKATFACEDIVLL